MRRDYLQLGQVGQRQVGQRAKRVVVEQDRGQSGEASDGKSVHARETLRAEGERVQVGDIYA